MTVVTPLRVLERYLQHPTCPRPPARALVLGAGEGREVVLLARAGFDVTAVELHPWWARGLQQRLRTLGLHATVHAGRAETYLPRLAGFHLVVALEFFCTVPPAERPRLLQRCAQVLHDRGVIFAVRGVPGSLPEGLEAVRVAEAVEAVVIRRVHRPQREEDLAG